jgi:hypothetical protein
MVTPAQTNSNRYQPALFTVESSDIACNDMKKPMAPLGETR